MPSPKETLGTREEMPCPVFLPPLAVLFQCMLLKGNTSEQGAGFHPVAAANALAPSEYAE